MNLKVKVVVKILSKMSIIIDMVIAGLTVGAVLDQTMAVCEVVRTLVILSFISTALAVVTSFMEE